MPLSSLTMLPSVQGPDSQRNGISRSLALGRILHFEALMRRRLGEVRAQRYVRLHNYYANQNLPPDNVDQPLLINRVKPIVDKHTSYLWGQWKNRLFTWRVTPKGKDSMDPDMLEVATEYGRRIKSFLDMVYDQNQGDKTFWKVAKNQSLYGDGVIEVYYDETQRRVVIKSVVPEYYHCMWDIADMQTLREVIIAYPIDRAEALERFHTSGNDQFIGYQAINPHYLPGIGILWKRWSTTSFQVWVDETNVINAPNPYMPIDNVGNIYPGIIPFEHLPNMQAGAEYWGYGDAENILYLSDELNRRMADMGDIVNSHGHPIITLKGYTGDQNDLPVGPDAVWDLGRDGEAARLEGKGPHPDVMAYIAAVKEEMAETASMPEAAYGTRKGGTSHNSGLALSMAMMPVVERAREKRIGWSESLTRVARMIFYMLYVRDPGLLEAVGLSYPQILLFDIEPVFADVLPKDELQVVNEAVATNVNGLKSLERSLELLGEEDIQTEIRRIKEDMLFKAQVGMATPPPEGGTVGKNSDAGLGGSADLPGGIGAGAGKPGTLINSNELPQVDNVGLSQTA